MITVLHEIGLHMNAGTIHKDSFKIVYVAPMKALAAEVSCTFGNRLADLGIQVRSASFPACPLKLDGFLLFLHCVLYACCCAPFVQIGVSSLENRRHTSG